MKRLIAALAPLLAIAALGATPAMAGIESVWQSRNKTLTRGTPVPVKLYGSLGFYVNIPFFRTTCHVKGSGTVENPAAGSGVASITELNLERCNLELPEGLLKEPLRAHATVTAGNLPWSSHLVAPLVVDEIEKIVLSFTFSVKNEPPQTIIVAGTLKPAVSAHGLVFGPEESGTLSSTEGVAAVTGFVRIEGPAGMKQITALP